MVDKKFASGRFFCIETSLIVSRLINNTCWRPTLRERHENEMFRATPAKGMVTFRFIQRSTTVGILETEWRLPCLKELNVSFVKETIWKRRGKDTDKDRRRRRGQKGTRHQLAQKGDQGSGLSTQRASRIIYSKWEVFSAKPGMSPLKFFQKKQIQITWAKAGISYGKI